jgi:hypothetical protein
MTSPLTARRRYSKFSTVERVRAHTRLNTH